MLKDRRQIRLKKAPKNRLSPGFSFYRAQHRLFLLGSHVQSFLRLNTKEHSSSIRVPRSFSRFSETDLKNREYLNMSLLNTIASRNQSPSPSKPRIRTIQSDKSCSTENDSIEKQESSRPRTKKYGFSRQLP